MVADIYTVFWILGVIAFGYSCAMFVFLENLKSSFRNNERQSTKLIARLRTFTTIMIFVFILFIVYGHMIYR
jgi:amino acid permease